MHCIYLMSFQRLISSVVMLWVTISCHRVDIVEGMVNKGIYLNGDKGATFLQFGNYKDSCISDPTLCGPEGKFL